MNSKLIRRIVGEGQSTPQHPAPRRSSVMARVLGEDIGVATRADQKPETPSQPDRTPTPSGERDEMTDMTELPQEADSGVEALAGAWQSGSKQDVAFQVASGIPYTDLVALIFMIGQDSAMELAMNVDEIMAQEEDAQTGQEPSGGPSPMVGRVTGGEAQEPEPEPEPEAQPKTEKE